MTEEQLHWEHPAVYRYAWKVAQRNVGRFRGELDLDDLMQEFAIAWIRAVDKDDGRHKGPGLMALFKTGVEWTLGKLLIYHGAQCRDSKSKVLESTIEGGPDGDDRSWLNVVGEDDSGMEEAQVMEAVNSAPDRVREYLLALVTDTLKRPGETHAQAVRRVTGWSSTKFHPLLREWKEGLLAAG